MPNQSRSCPTIHFANETQARYNDLSSTFNLSHRLPKASSFDGPFKETFDKALLDDSRARLKASASTSHILCGFAMVCAAELQSNDPGDTNLPDPFWICYVVNTVLLVCVHAFSIMISTYVMPKLDVEIKNPTIDSYKLKSFVEIAWVVSNLLGLFLFLIELQLLLWVKFWDFALTAAIGGTVVLVPIILLFVYLATYSYYSHVKLRLSATTNKIKDLEDISRKLDAFQ